MCGTAKRLLTPWDPNDDTEGTGETLSDPKVGTEGTDKHWDTLRLELYTIFFKYLII